MDIETLNLLVTNFGIISTKHIHVKYCGALISIYCGNSCNIYLPILEENY